jgi:hypothetical protein
MNEAEAVRDLLSRLTDCPFRICEPDPFEPVAEGEPVWFVSCPELIYCAEVAHALLAWKGSTKNVMIQTIPLRYNVHFIERVYGLIAGDIAHDAGLLDFEDPRARTRLAEDFPLSEELLRVYEGVAERTAKEKGVTLRLVYAGKRRARRCSYGAIVKSREDLASELAEIERSVDALKEAYRELVRIEHPDVKEW